MKLPIGRPLKYKLTIKHLIDEHIYSPATIAIYAGSNGLLKATDPAGIRLEKQRIRITMGRFSNNHDFPDQGDGIVTLPGQAPVPGWFGWRWKAALKC